MKKGLPFDITLEDIDIPDFCPALGIPLFRAKGRKAQGPNSPTLDRLDPDLGYVTGNVMVVSARANQIKSDSTPSELYRVACFVMGHTREH